MATPLRRGSVNPGPELSVYTAQVPAVGRGGLRPPEG
jgi:hypothetical protein